MLVASYVLLCAYVALGVFGASLYFGLLRSRYDRTTREKAGVICCLCALPISVVAAILARLAN